MKDIMIDAKRLAKAISPAAWGKLFEDGPGSGISVSRVLDCIQDSKRANDPSEGYIQQHPAGLLHQFLILTSDKPAFETEPALRAKLCDVYTENTSGFSGGERSLFSALLDISDPRFRFRFYLCFHDVLDRLIELATRAPRPKAILVD